MEVTMKYEIDCGVCGEPVTLSRQSYMKHEENGTLPLCRKNGCFRYERLVDKENTTATRTSQNVTATHVKGVVLIHGRGKKGHQAAPLANSRIRQCGPTIYGGADEIDN